MSIPLLTELATLKTKSEQVRDRLAEILALNLAKQKTIAQNLLQTETDPVTRRQLTLIIKCIPDVVYRERSVPLSANEQNYVNVVFSTNPLDDENTGRNQAAFATYFIKITSSAEDTQNTSGDTLAAEKCQRLLWLCWGILANDTYAALGQDIKGGEPALINSKTNVHGLVVGEPDQKENSLYTVSGMFEYRCKVSELAGTITGETITGFDNKLKPNDMGNGFLIDTP